jgi:hypothetical protein
MATIYEDVAIVIFEDSRNPMDSLNEVKANKDITILRLQRKEYDISTVNAVCDLLELHDRKWDTISFVNRCDRLLQEEPSDDAVVLLERLFGSIFSPVICLKHFRLTQTICPTVATLIADGLRDNGTIESLDLHWSTIEVGSISQLCEGLRTNQGLRRLDLSSCDLKDSEIGDIVRALRDHPSLDSLMLAFNNCGKQGIFQLSKLLRSPFCPVHCLDLSFQQRQHGNKLDCQSLLDALNKNKSLHYLNLTCNRLDDNDAECIADVLAHNSTLHDLLLARNNFTDEGMKHLAKTLSRTTGLKKLSLWGNRMTETGAEALLSAMLTNTEVHTLNLFHQFRTVCDKIDFIGHFNRVGRRLLHRQPNEVPMGLWPLLLERGNTVKLSPPKDGVYHDEASCRAEIIYNFLHSSILDSVLR